MIGAMPSMKPRRAPNLAMPRRATSTTGFAATLAWYLANESWWRGVLDGSYRNWVETNYQSR